MPSLSRNEDDCTIDRAFLREVLVQGYVLPADAVLSATHRPERIEALEAANGEIHDSDQQ